MSVQVHYQYIMSVSVHYHNVLYHNNVCCWYFNRRWLMKAGLAGLVTCRGRVIYQSFTVDWWTLTRWLHSRRYVPTAMVSCITWVSCIALR